jgi:acyl carrier protein
VSIDHDRVITIIERELDLSAGHLTKDTAAPDVEGWDSLGHLRVCMALEAAFGVSFDMERVGELQTPGALAECIDSLLAA